jgi:hypothetical protein
MRLIGAFDPILKVAAWGRQKARYGIDAVRRTRTAVPRVVLACTIVKALRGTLGNHPSGAQSTISH